MHSLHLDQIRRGDVLHEVWTGPNVIKPFTAVIYGYLYKSRVFDPVTPFQPNLMLIGKARAYLLD